MGIDRLPPVTISMNPLISCLTVKVQPFFSIRRDHQRVLELRVSCRINDGRELNSLQVMSEDDFSSNFDRYFETAKHHLKLELEKTNKQLIDEARL